MVAAASMLLGLILAALACPAGRFLRHFGAWDRIARVELVNRSKRGRGVHAWIWPGKLA